MSNTELANQPQQLPHSVTGTGEHKEDMNGDTNESLSVATATAAAITTAPLSMVTPIVADEAHKNDYSFATPKKGHNKNTSSAMDMNAVIDVQDADAAISYLALNRTPITITWKDVNYAVTLPRPGLIQRLKNRRKGNAEDTTKTEDKNQDKIDKEEVLTAEADPVKHQQQQPGQSGVSASVTPMDPNAPKIKQILTNVSGHCAPGQLIAIMGSSGAGMEHTTYSYDIFSVHTLIPQPEHSHSFYLMFFVCFCAQIGKTTLLNLLSQRVKQDMTGEILLNGRPSSLQTLKHSAFVQQSDLFFKELTVGEHLNFHAKLRLANVTEPQRKRTVDALIQELGLSDVRDSKIGEVGQGGISGGERRRLSFASELISNPSIVFLDEPTSGLDSFLAESIIQTLKKMARNGRSIICTIHQPSSEIYTLFDQVMYLSQGRVAYFGTLPHALEYYAELGYKCPSYTNPADFVIRNLSVLPACPEESKTQIRQLLETWSHSKEQATILGEISEINQQFANVVNNKLLAPTTTNANGDGEEYDDTRSRYAASFFTQLTTLYHRSTLATLRDPILTKARAIQAIVIAVVIGLIYLRLRNNQKSVQDKMGAIFVCIINQSMGGVFGVLSTFTQELPIFLREHRSGLYSSYSYYLSRTFAELPFQILWPFLFVTIVYWMIGLNDNGGRYIEFTLAIILTANAAMSLGYVIATGAPTIQVALAIGAPVLLPFMLFGGLFINVNSIPDYFYWLSYISFFKYGFELSSVIVWDGVAVINCDAGENCTVDDGAQVLNQYGMDPNNAGQDVGILFAILIGFRIIAYLFLLRRASKRI